MEVSGQLHGLAALLPGMTLVLGGLEGYRGGLNLLEKIKKSCTARIRTQALPASNLVTIHVLTELTRLLKFVPWMLAKLGLHAN